MWRTASMGLVERARKETEGSPHKDTEAIIFRGPKDASYESFFDDVLTVDYRWPESIQVVSLVHQLADYSLHRSWRHTPPGRVMIVKLPPGKHITCHCDQGKYAEATTRQHIVLQSDPGNEFWCNGETAQMKPGETWWFNHQLPHSVSNKSNTDRIHLIVDSFK